MKKNTLIAVLTLLAFTASASGQPLRGSYFFETSLMRNKLNASFAPQNIYISLPLISYTGIDCYSNVGLANFFFRQGKNANVTFLHPSISTDQFLSNLPAKDPFVKEKLETDVIGAGFPLGERGFLTIDLAAVENADVQIPKELLRFAKSGGSATIHDLNASAGAYAQLALGYSHDLGDIVEGLHLGGRVKFLTGVAAAEANVSRVDIVMDGQQLAATTSGTGYLAGFDFEDFNNWSNLGLNGFGLAFDLGVEYRIPFDHFFNGLNLSASVNDLGFLGFNKHVTKLSSSGSASFSGFQGIDPEYDFNTNLQNVFDDFSKLANYSASNADKFSYKLSPSIYVGAEAPFLHEMMSLGLLYYYTKGCHNLMASYNLKPIRWFNFGVNYTFLGPARTFGLYIEFIPKKVVGIFAGANVASFKTNSWGIPIKNLTESACFGINVVFGGK